MKECFNGTFRGKMNVHQAIKEMKGKVPDGEDGLPYACAMCTLYMNCKQKDNPEECDWVEHLTHMLEVYL